MTFAPQRLEVAAAWCAADVKEPTAWTIALSQDDHAELDSALRVCASGKAIEVLSATAARSEYNVEMVFERGDIQFVNNHRVLHGRAACVDAPDLGLRRHMKRLWLGTERLSERPRRFRRKVMEHWERPVAREVGL
jgi:hypothetical protein